MKKTNINTLLLEIYTLEHYLDKKKSANDIKEQKRIIDSQEIQLYNLLKDRNTEEKVLSDIISKIETDAKQFEEKSGVKDVISISKLNGFERNFESIFKKSILLIRTEVKELYNFYEKQKLLDGKEFAVSFDYEQKKIMELKNILNSIVNSENQITEYIKDVEKLKISRAAKEDYVYLGLKIPRNINIVDPISKYDLEPFLRAYSAFEKELSQAIIHVKYLHIESDTMWSQYRNFLFHKPEKRIYVIFISSNKDNSRGGVVSLLTHDEKVGWYAHELSHFAQYIKMSNIQLFGFSVSYIYNWAISRLPFRIPLLSKKSFNYMKQLERFTDSQVIEKGLGAELYKGSHFFLESNVSEKRKKRYSEIYTPLHENIDAARAEYMRRISSQRNKGNN